MPQLQPITLVAPGRFGMNSEKEYNLLAPEWATEAKNAVITDGGRLAAREGWASATANEIATSDSIDVMFEYLTADGTPYVISAAGNKIYKNVDNFTLAANDITSATTPTADNWHFVNFNGYVLGVQDSHNAIQWNESGDFTDQVIVSTGQPSTPNPGNCSLGAFGRYWFCDDNMQTIWYSALLNHDDLTTLNGAGYIDMTSIWTQGMDQVVALAAFGSNLVVFGKNHIVIWADGQGSAIGLNPEQMYVADTIEGTGCIARDSVQMIGEGDIWYLSRHGLQSLGRVMAERTNPLIAITKNVHTSFVGDVQVERSTDLNLDAVRSIYSPEHDMYLLFLPGRDKVWYIDTSQPFNDGTGMAYPITEWVLGGDIKSGLATRSGNLYFGSSGLVGQYSSSVQQDNGEAYTYSFWTGWLDLGPDMNNRLKMLKEVATIIQVSGGSEATYRWEFDFSGDVDSYTVNYDTPGAAEYGIAEYSAGVGETGYVGTEYAGALSLQRKNFAGTNQGQFLRIGNTVNVNGFRFITQQIQLVPKLGRMMV
jgi:hypothetical protein